MSKSETVEDKTLKDLMYMRLCEWLKGSALREYKSLGHELDVFHISVYNDNNSNDVWPDNHYLAWLLTY